MTAPAVAAPAVDGQQAVACADALRKRASTAQARAALAGFELVAMLDGSFVAARSESADAPRMLATLDEVEAWLGQERAA